MFPLFPRGVESNIVEKSSQLALEHEFRISSRVKEPFLKLKLKAVCLHITDKLTYMRKVKNKPTSHAQNFLSTLVDNDVNVCMLLLILAVIVITN